MLTARARRRRQWHRKRRGVRTTPQAANKIKDAKSIEAMRKRFGKKK